MSVNNNNSCPCTYLEEPCSSNCSCKNPYMSGGCNYCCTYGSGAQREYAAKTLKKLYRKNIYVMKITAVFRFLGILSVLYLGLALWNQTFNLMAAPGCLTGLVAFLVVFWALDNL